MRGHIGRLQDGHLSTSLHLVPGEALRSSEAGVLSTAGPGSADLQVRGNGRSENPALAVAVLRAQSTGADNSRLLSL